MSAAATVTSATASSATSAATVVFRFSSLGNIAVQEHIPLYMKLIAAFIQIVTGIALRSGCVHVSGHNEQHDCGYRTADQKGDSSFTKC